MVISERISFPQRVLITGTDSEVLEVREKIACKCCGCLTIEYSFDICPICGWEQDDIQELDPEYKGGANGDLSLNEAKENYLQFGACHEKLTEFVREPFPEEISMNE